MQVLARIRRLEAFDVLLAILMFVVVFALFSRWEVALIAAIISALWLREREEGEDYG